MWVARARNIKIIVKVLVKTESELYFGITSHFVFFMEWGDDVTKSQMNSVFRSLVTPENTAIDRQRRLSRPLYYAFFLVYLTSQSSLEIQ